MPGSGKWAPSLPGSGEPYSSSFTLGSFPCVGGSFDSAAFSSSAFSFCSAGPLSLVIFPNSSKFCSGSSFFIKASSFSSANTSFSVSSLSSIESSYLRKEEWEGERVGGGKIEARIIIGSNCHCTAKQPFAALSPEMLLPQAWLLRFAPGHVLGLLKTWYY